MLCWGTIYDGPRVACTSQIYATQVQVLRYSTKAQTQLGLRFVPFPGVSSSGVQVLGESTLPRWAVCLIISWFQPLGFLGALQECRLRCAVCLLWRVDLRLQSSWQMSTVQDPRKTWLATGSLLTVWWMMPSLGPRLSLAFQLWLLPACLSASGGKGTVCSWLALLW